MIKDKLTKKIETLKNNINDCQDLVISYSQDLEIAIEEATKKIKIYKVDGGIVLNILSDNDSYKYRIEIRAIGFFSPWFNSIEEIMVWAKTKQYSAKEHDIIDIPVRISHKERNANKKTTELSQGQIPGTEEWIGVSEAASIASVSKDAIKYACDNDKLTHKRVPHRGEITKRLIDKQSLLRYIARRDQAQSKEHKTEKPKPKQKQISNDYLLNVNEVAKILRVSSVTVSNLAKRGDIKCVNLSLSSKRKLRFSFNDVMDFIDEKRKG